LTPATGTTTLTSMSHTLLLADDSVTVQRVIELTFADEGFKVVSFSDGDEVVGYLEAGNTPDVILADTTMPARDGYDVAAWVKGRDVLNRVPVVLMTGAFEPIDDKRAEACQADAVLVKPFEPQQVVSLVKRMLAGERGTLLGEFAPPQPAGPGAPDPEVTLAPGLDTYAQRLDDHLAARQRRPTWFSRGEANGDGEKETGEASEPAAPQPPQLTFDTDYVIWFYAVKGANTADFERFFGRVKEAMAKSDQPGRREQAQGMKLLKSTATAPDGTATYVLFINPVSKNTEYSPGMLLFEVFPSEAKQLVDELQTYINTQGLNAAVPMNEVMTLGGSGGM